VNTQNTNLG